MFFFFLFIRDETNNQSIKFISFKQLVFNRQFKKYMVLLIFFNIENTVRPAVHGTKALPRIRFYVSRFMSSIWTQQSKSSLFETLKL